VYRVSPGIIRSRAGIVPMRTRAWMQINTDVAGLQLEQIVRG
jgi:hypothetical protein